MSSSGYDCSIRMFSLDRCCRYNPLLERKRIGDADWKYICQQGTQPHSQKDALQIIRGKILLENKSRDGGLVCRMKE